jgi:hypothetical protein
MAAAKSNASKTNRSGVGGGGGGGGGGSGNRGSSIGAKVGTRGGKNAPAARTSGRQPAGTKPTSAVRSVASRGKTAINGSNPMAGQGVSFKTPTAAKIANKAYTKKVGFGNRVMKSPELKKTSALKDVQDIRRQHGPYDPRDPKYAGWSRGKWTKMDPNNPEKGKFPNGKMSEGWKRHHQAREDRFRSVIAHDPLRTPRETAERARSIRDTIDNSESSYFTKEAEKNRSLSRRPSSYKEITSHIPDTPIGNRTAMSIMGSSGGGTGYKGGGVVKSGESKVWKALDKAAEYVGWNQDVARSKLAITKHKADARKALKKKKK